MDLKDVWNTLMNAMLSERKNRVEYLFLRNLRSHETLLYPLQIRLRLCSLQLIIESVPFELHGEMLQAAVGVGVGVVIRPLLI